MKRLMLVAVAALAFAAPASAKEILGAQLCGVSGCETDRSSSLHEGPGGPFTDGGPAGPPAKPGAWYRGYALAGDRGKVFAKLPFYYIPGGTIVQPGTNGQTTTWQPASAEWRAALDRLAAKVKPFGVPTITRVSLNGRTAADPQSYLRVYSEGSKADDYPRNIQSTQIVLESEGRTPWTDGNYVVLYPDAKLLVRDGQIVSISGGMADRIVARKSLAPDGGSFPWLPVALAIAAAALLGTVVALRRRLPGRHPLPEPQA